MEVAVSQSISHPNIVQASLLGCTVCTNQHGVNGSDHEGITMGTT